MSMETPDKVDEASKDVTQGLSTLVTSASTHAAVTLYPSLPSTPETAGRTSDILVALPLQDRRARRRGYRMVGVPGWRQRQTSVAYNMRRLGCKTGQRAKLIQRTRSQQCARAHRRMMVCGELGVVQESRGLLVLHGDNWRSPRHRVRVWDPGGVCGSTNSGLSGHGQQQVPGALDNFPQGALRGGRAVLAYAGPARVPQVVSQGHARSQLGGRCWPVLAPAHAAAHAAACSREARW